jgi:hypothetical protein
MQSFVRQLNFYSFRKINKERNRWIYQHEYFHRDRPEEFHMIKRTTVGKKSSSSTKDPHNSSDEDETMIDEATEENLFSSSQKKRTRETVQFSPNKKSTVSVQWKPQSEDRVVDTSMLQVDSLTVAEEDDDDQNSETRHNPDTKDQSRVVATVASKLEKYARKAGRSTGRNTRGGRTTGIITPPYGQCGAPTGTLLTYDDDEYKYEAFHRAAASRNDSNVRMAIPDDSSFEKVSPVVSVQTAQSIIQRIVDSSSDFAQGTLVAAANVAGFCMATAPVYGNDLCNKILQLLASCEAISTEFRFYRSALQPHYHNSSIQQHMWEGEGKSHAIRDFITFSVNCIKQILNVSALSHNEIAILERTAGIWQKSIRA